MFNNMQDRELMKGVLVACEDKFFWLWMNSVGARVIHRIEGIRHWSLVCNCPQHMREREEARELGKQVKHNECMRNSRRLGDVVKFITAEIAALRDAANTYTAADAENDPKAFESLRNASQKAWSLLQERTKYFFLVPWRLADADTASGAKACVEQLSGVIEKRLDPLSLRVKRTLLGDLQVVADGGAVSAPLRLVIDILRDCPLDESAGEGYHRETNLAHQRAPASTAQTVVQEVRFKKNMDRIETFLDTYKHQARATVRYEWRNWKRVLQSSKKKLHRNKHMQDTAAMKRVYRMNAMARGNWDIAFRRGEEEDALPIEDDDVDAVQREYLAALFCVHHVFSSSRRTPSGGAQG
jgi:hypothetical protein